VALDMKESRKLLEDIEELEPMRAYDAAAASRDAAIPLEQATQEIERSRK
jgi:hypothetical protein